MDIFKIIGVGLIGGILSMTVKQYKKEYALLVALATVTVILFFTLDTLETAISQISLITEKSGVDTRYFTAVMKVVGVAYITQFGAEILRDGDCFKGRACRKGVYIGTDSADSYGIFGGVCKCTFCCVK